VKQRMPENVTLLSSGDQGGAAGCIISKVNKHWQVYQLLESPTLENRMSAEYSMLQLYMTQCVIDRSYTVKDLQYPGILFVHASRFQD